MANDDKAPLSSNQGERFPGLANMSVFIEEMQISSSLTLKPLNI